MFMSLFTTFWKKVGPKFNPNEVQPFQKGSSEVGWAKINLFKKGSSEAGWAKIYVADAQFVGVGFGPTFSQKVVLAQPFFKRLYINYKIEI
jgi:hypothetical protein